VLDEPTDLPAGETVYLQPVGADELDDASVLDCTKRSSRASNQ
jgi:hypothetical protein